MNRRYRKTIIAGNWKMNKTASETKTVRRGAQGHAAQSQVVRCRGLRSRRQHSRRRARLFKERPRSPSAPRTCHYEKYGAFTGEVSADMLKDLGVKYVIIGH